MNILIGVIATVVAALLAGGYLCASFNGKMRYIPWVLLSTANLLMIGKTLWPELFQGETRISPVDAEIHLAEDVTGNIPKRSSWIIPSVIETAAQGVPPGTICTLTIDTPSNAHPEPLKFWVGDVSWLSYDESMDGSRELPRWRSASLPTISGTPVRFHLQIGSVPVIMALTPGPNQRPKVLQCPGHESRMIPGFGEWTL